MRYAPIDCEISQLFTIIKAAVAVVVDVVVILRKCLKYYHTMKIY